jgi:hypothetical protein
MINNRSCSSSVGDFRGNNRKLRIIHNKSCSSSWLDLRGTIWEQGIINNKSCSSSWLDFRGKVGEQGIRRSLCQEQLAFLTRLELETAALLETLPFTTQFEL